MHGNALRAQVIFGVSRQCLRRRVHGFGVRFQHADKLHADGLISGEWEEKDTGRKRRYYRLTRIGRAALREKRDSWQRLSTAVNQILEKSDGQA